MLKTFSDKLYDDKKVPWNSTSATYLFYAISGLVTEIESLQCMLLFICACLFEMSNHYDGFISLLSFPNKDNIWFSVHLVNKVVFGGTISVLSFFAEVSLSRTTFILFTIPILKVHWIIFFKLGQHSAKSHPPWKACFPTKKWLLIVLRQATLFHESRGQNMTKHWWSQKRRSLCWW